MIRNLLEQLLISLYRKQQECPAQVQSLPMQSLGMEYQIVRQVVTFLDQNIYNNITFVDVASHFNLSETQLKKLFREVTGYSVMQYYRKKRGGAYRVSHPSNGQKFHRTGGSVQLQLHPLFFPSFTSARQGTRCASI